MQKKLRILVAIIMIANLMALNWYVLHQKDMNDASLMTTVPSSDDKTEHTEMTCDQVCVDKLYAAIASLSGETETVMTQETEGPEVTEFFVSFGSGNGSSTAYQNVTGMQTYVNSTSYKNIKQVVFEASVTIPTQNQSASLQVFNTTAEHPVWNSTVTFQSGQQTQFLISQPVQLDPGNNLYQVQLQTQLGAPVVINQARFHITTY